MAHPDEIQAVLKRIFEDPGGDVTNAHEIYHDDAVLEFPQSGERFEGVDAFTAWRSEYPAEVTFRIRRTVIFEDFSLVEPLFLLRVGNSTTKEMSGATSVRRTPK